MNSEKTRHLGVQHTVDRIREIQRDRGITRDSLEAVKMELIDLAKRKVFSLTEFPPPTAGAPRASCLYRLAEGTDHRFALYLNVARGGVDTPAHNHTTWAVIVGIEGEEINHFYRRSNDGVERIRIQVVSPGSGVAMLADDLHSIHIHSPTPVVNFHMYGLGLEQLHERQFFDTDCGSWKTFPAHTDIREARGPQTQ